MVLMSSATAIPLENMNLQSILRFDNLSYAIDSLAHLLIDQQESNEYFFFVGDALIGVSGLTVNYRTEEKEAPEVSWTQHRVSQEGTWKGPWIPSSCVHQNGHGETSIKFTVRQALSVSPTWKPGFNINYGKIAALRFGYTIAEKIIDTELRTYTVPPRNYGQIWQQQLMIWQDQQLRKCSKKLGIRGLTLGEWSENIRGDLPISNTMTFGWSTGWDKVDFKKCGGSL